MNGYQNKHRKLMFYQKMEIKVEIERPLLCYGCLSSDRRLTKVNDELSRLFYVIRSDGNNASSNTLQLCWECLAVLKRISRFQQQVITAQFELLQCMPYLYLNNENNMPTSLSSLQYAHINQETYNFKYEETVFKNTAPIPKNNIKTIEQNNITDLKKYSEPKVLFDHLKNKLSNIEISVTPHLLDNIKKEQDFEDIDIKDEFDDHFNCNNLGFEEQLPKQKKVRKKRPKQLWNNIRMEDYKKYTTIIDRKDEFKSSLNDKKNIQKYCEIVQISESDYEKNMLESDVRWKLSKEGKRMKKAVCRICRLTCKRFYDLVKHKAFEHDKTPFPRKCTTCETLTQSKSEFMSHWSLCQSVGYKCLLCPDIYRDTTDMKVHLTTVHTKVYKCNECSEFEAPRMREFFYHYKAVHQQVICDYCERTLLSKKVLIKHILKYHTPHFCQKCDRSYKTKLHYDRHCAIFHMTEEKSKELSYCVECDRQFPSVARFKRHLGDSVRHKPRVPVKIPCPDCGKIFAKTIYMKNHYNLMHLKATKHYCSECDKYYCNGYALRKHIQYVHQKATMPKNKMCDICGRGFSTNRILENHRRTHTGERPYKCPYCTASFAQKSAMNTHQKTQHKNVISFT